MMISPSVDAENINIHTSPPPIEDQGKLHDGGVYKPKHLKEESKLPYYMKFLRHLNFANLAIFKKSRN